MPWLPYERVVLRTKVPADELMRRLAMEVEPRKSFRSPFAGHRTYQGELTGTTFNVARIIGYRNSFLPMLKGRVRPDGTGAVLEATLSLHPVVLGFMVFFLGSALAIGLTLLMSLVLQGKNPALALFPTGMFLFGYLLMQGAFSFESTQARRFLEALAETHRA
jgi:hypothetical protein